MKVFELRGTHPRVLLVNQLQSREEKWYRAPASTVFILTLRTKITRVPCRKRTGTVVPRAENSVTKLREQCAELKKGPLQYCLEGYCYLRYTQDLLSDGKTPFKLPIIPFGSMVDYHPISAKDVLRLPPVRQESLTRNNHKVKEKDRQVLQAHLHLHLLHLHRRKP